MARGDEIGAITRIVPVVRASRRRALAGTISWSAFMALALAAMLVSLLRLAGTGPAGAAHTSAWQTSSGSGSINAVGPPPSVSAKAAYVFDADLGFTYYTKNADLELPMASCTKIMTMLLAVEHAPLDMVITVGADAAALVRPDSSYMGLSVGERLTLEDLLYGLVLPSGNDAAVAIADAVGGTQANFVTMMNARAQQLGLTHTHFENPHGLGQDGHYTTARDLAILAGVAMQSPALVTVTSTRTYSIPKTAMHKAYALSSGIDLLSGGRYPYPGAIGVKPGYTGDAGYCEAFAAIRHGHLMVGVVLDEPTWQIRMVDMRDLLDWGFEQENIPPSAAPVPWSHPAAD
jgi:serine-type D-Ala-D-Ala carboxypeptidase (penicillin-binding protein 5/6)